MSLLAADGDVLALVWRPEDLGPFAALVDGPLVAPSPQAATGRRGHGQLRFGAVIVEAAAAAAWDPRPDWPAVAPRWSLLREHTGRWLRLAGPVAALPFDPVASSRELAVALADGAEAHAAEIATRLAGLGPGLTPAGDDVLLGVVLACFATAIGDRRAGVVAEAVRGRSTTLSEAWLRVSCEGEAAAPWHRLIEAIAAADERRLEQAASALLEVGASSGRTALSGFAAAAEVLLDRRQIEHGGARRCS